MKRIILMMCAVVLFASCTTEIDKNKCRLKKVTVVSDAYSVSKIVWDGDGSDYYNYYERINKFLVIDGDTVEYDDTVEYGGIYPGIGRQLQKGDSVWIFLDWKDRKFYSAQADVQTAIDAYANSKMFSFWEDVVMMVIIMVLWLGWLFFLEDDYEYGCGCIWFTVFFILFFMRILLF